MNILVLCPHFAPDVAPTGEVMTRIVTELAARGHGLHVVTALPWYRHHALEPGWDGQLVRSERTPWGRITRVHPFPTDKRNIPARALAFGGFTALSTLVGGAARTKPDVVLAMSPPLTLGPAGWAIARTRGSRSSSTSRMCFPTWRSSSATSGASALSRRRGGSNVRRIDTPMRSRSCPRILPTTCAARSSATDPHRARPTQIVCM